MFQMFLLQSSYASICLPLPYIMLWFMRHYHTVWPFYKMNVAALQWFQPRLYWSHLAQCEAQLACKADQCRPNYPKSVHELSELKSQKFKQAMPLFEGEVCKPKHTAGELYYIHIICPFFFLYVCPRITATQYVPFQSLREIKGLSVSTTRGRQIFHWFNENHRQKRGNVQGIYRN